MHLSNLILDWYNYFQSGGREEDVPIKGVMANFNAGDPFLLAPYLADVSDRSDRVFFDFVAYLNRTELSIFGFQHYRSYENNAVWNVSDLFIDETIKCNVITKEGPIRNKLMNVIMKMNFPGLDRQLIADYANELLDTIVGQVDVL